MKTAEDSIFKVVPQMHKGHALFEINHITREVLLVDVFVDEGGKTRCMPKEGCEYVSALNMKNAIKKYNKQK